MKLAKGQRKIDYFGVEMIVPNDDIWIATDESGQAYMYDSAPCKGVRAWSRNRVDSTAYRVGQFDLEGTDFAGTLKHYPADKPTLIRANFGQVDFFGVKLFAPSYGWLAMNKDGSVFWHKYEPFPKRTDDWRTATDHCILLGEVRLSGVHWCDAKIKI